MIFRGFLAAAGLAVLALVQGCAALMAERGSPPATNLSGLREGLTRVEAELFVGTPISSISTSDGRRIEIYEVDGGTPPDKSRALVHFLLDASTLLAWEVIGTPMEAVIRLARNPEQIAIVYGWDERVLAIHRLGRGPAQRGSTGAPPPPLASPPSPPFSRAEGGLP